MGEIVDPDRQPSRRRGRPRAFNKTHAIDAAMRLFWAEGYNAASIDRICRETGMSRASLYHDFGGKQGLFLAAISHYVETRLAPLAEALGPRDTLKGDLAAFFDEVVALATRDAATPGCLISCVLAEVAGANETFRQELDHRFRALEDRIVQRLAQETGTGAAMDQRALAGMLAAVARGIMLRARSGMSAEALHRIAAVTIDSALMAQDRRVS